MSNDAFLDDITHRTTIKIDNEEIEVSPENLERVRILGNGQNGAVLLMRHTPSNKLMAVKRITFNNDNTEQHGRELKLSLNTQNCFYLIRSYGALYHEFVAWILMEVMQADLQVIYEKAKKMNIRLSESFLRRIAFIVLKTLNYLDQVWGTLHRDIKPSNILVNQDGTVKLCDFGICGRLGQRSNAHTFIGHSRYMAPERIIMKEKQHSYNIRSEVWSLGLTLYELATRQLPYCKARGDFGLATAIVDGPPPSLEEDEETLNYYSDDFNKFIKKCLVKDEEDRDKPETLLLKDEWIKGEYEIYLKSVNLTVETENPLDCHPYECSVQSDRDMLKRIIDST
ncbi:hypothetical protein SNEBB_011100 [Seison nebaliae]|nr:hypothetical protein SNEBB_011100 [Seison nebaliae]